MKLRTWEEITNKLNEENGANYSSEYYWGDVPEYQTIEQHLTVQVQQAKAGHCYDINFVRLCGGKRLAQCLDGVHKATIDLHKLCVQIGRENEGFNALEITI